MTAVLDRSCVDPVYKLAELPSPLAEDTFRDPASVFIIRLHFVSQTTDVVLRFPFCRLFLSYMQ
jgi:hypothetical protein